VSRYESHVGTDLAIVEMARAVRRTVFIEEQGVAESEEMDGKDGEAVHVVVTDGDDPVGTARVRFPDETTAKVERVAVLPTYRGEGIGRTVMLVAESRAAQRGADTATLHSQVRVQEFYESLGYEPVGDRFEEADIPHIAMVKDLSRADSGSGPDSHSRTSR
jgi:predicted GNAT family N-acyltransferase